MAYGELGPTHHSIEDLSWTRAIDNLRVAVPADPAQTRAAVRWASRTPVRSTCASRASRSRRHAGRRAVRSRATSVRLTDGDDVTVIAAGTMVSARARRRSGCAATGSAARRQHAVRRPAGRGGGARRARETRGIVTAEEGIVSGGLGRRGGEPRRPAPARADAHPRRHGFAPTGSAGFLLDHFGLTADGIAGAARAPAP
jgi:transketolase